MENNSDKLVVLWTSGDRETANKMAFMYTLNSKLRGWWKEVTLIVWGPSAKLLSEDMELRGKIELMKEAGVELFACKACTDQYGVTDNLAQLGLTVVYMGEPLTEYLKDGAKVLTI